MLNFRMLSGRPYCVQGDNDIFCQFGYKFCHPYLRIIQKKYLRSPDFIIAYEHWITFWMVLKKMICHLKERTDCE
jgi:hypothetical protein